MTTSSGIYQSVERLCAQAESMTTGTPHESRAREISGRLVGPLRVAIAGRVKAGKSTLLNALVGERLAPTDAGECTRIAAWYRRGLGYTVSALLADGSVRPVSFKRGGGTLDITLEPLSPDEIVRLEVEWPSYRLEAITLIDTPGLGSHDAATSARTEDLLMPREGDPEVDAVVYLMRHLHRDDAEFLETFADPVTRTSPVNAVGVLSRADEVGAARPDALESARSIAARYSQDEQLRPLVGTVVPVAGLLAESGLTLREEELSALRAIAGLDGETIDAMLLSVDRFRTPQLSGLPIGRRGDLLNRLGLFGVRIAIEALRGGRIRTSQDLSKELVALSGIDELRALLQTRFVARARVLKARSALAALRSLSSDLRELGGQTTAVFDRELERVEASSHELAELRVLQALLEGRFEVGDEERTEIERLTSSDDSRYRVGLGSETSPAEVAKVALDAAQRWRRRAASPLVDRETARAAEVLARSYEGIFTEHEGHA